jgi:hypothetical protein
MCTGVTQGADTWPVGDLAPRRRQSRQLGWRELDPPSTLARLAAQSPYAACPPVALEQSARLSHARPVGTIGGKLEPAGASYSSLSSLFLSSSSLSCEQAICHRLQLCCRRRPQFSSKLAPSLPRG